MALMALPTKTGPMIIESKNEAVYLSGYLHKNLWWLVKSVVLMLLDEYPQGIVVDCQRLSSISLEGVDTFIEALYDIEDNSASVIFANLPEQSQLQVTRRTPDHLHRYLLPSRDRIQEWDLSAPPVWWEQLFGQTT